MKRIKSFLTIEHSISLLLNMKTATVNNFVKGFLA